MAEYIDKRFALYVVDYFNSMLTWSQEDIANEIKRAIEKEKCCDVYKVVYCKDCVQYHHSGYCKRLGKKFDVFPNDFCSYGKRKRVYLNG